MAEVIIDIKKIMELLQNLAAAKFHGKVVLTFTDGKIVRAEENKILFK